MCGPGPEKGNEDWDRDVFIVMPPNEFVPCVSEVKPITRSVTQGRISLQRKRYFSARRPMSHSVMDLSKAPLVPGVHCAANVMSLLYKSACSKLQSSSTLTHHHPASSSTKLTQHTKL